MNEIMSVKQLPIIEERLHNLKSDIETKIAEVMAWECTEDTVKQIKKLKSDLTKDFKELEDERKLVKTKIMAPYEAFEKVYKECVTELYTNADKTLKSRIDAIESVRLKEKEEKIITYFNEYATSKNIDFLKFPACGIKVTLSASESKMKEQAAAFIDRTVDDIEVINTMEYSTEILVEYQRRLNVAASIAAVNERHRMIELQRQKDAEQNERIEQNKIIQLQQIQEQLKAPTVEENQTEDEIIIMNVGKVKALRSDCKILKELLTNGKYEFIKE